MPHRANRVVEWFPTTVPPRRGPTALLSPYARRPPANKHDRSARFSAQRLASPRLSHLRLRDCGTSFLSSPPPPRLLTSRRLARFPLAARHTPAYARVNKSSSISSSLTSGKRLKLMPPPSSSSTSATGGGGSLASTLAWLAVGAAAGTVITVLTATTDERRRSLRSSIEGTIHRVGAAVAPNAGSSGSTPSSPQRSYRPPHEFTIKEPRGARWEEITRDFDDADAMPHAFTPEVAKHWESTPVHVRETDPFARHEGFVEALVACRRLPVAQLEQIMRDTPRTFPSDSFFADTDVQNSMKSILTAVALEYPQCGYVQSQNFIAAFLLLHAKTEDAAFCLFRRIMAHPRLALAKVYAPGLPLLVSLVQVLDRLIARYAPNAHASLLEARVDTLLFAQNWIMTLFVYSMPWETASTVWERFLEVGWEAILRVGVELVKLNERALVNADFERAFSTLRDAATLAPEDVMARAERDVPLDDLDKAMIASAVECVRVDVYAPAAAERVAPPAAAAGGGDGAAGAPPPPYSAAAAAAAAAAAVAESKKNA